MKIRFAIIVACAGTVSFAQIGTATARSPGQIFCSEVKKGAEYVYVCHGTNLGQPCTETGSCITEYERAKLSAETGSQGPERILLIKINNKKRRPM
jgi:hypothetical protein